jgi:hypothetical protein
MAGIEGERPQNQEGKHPPRAFMGGERYERSEVHRGGIPLTETRLRNGALQDISHLYTWLGADGQKCWRTERQSIASFLADVRAGKERKDPRYEHIPEDQIPSNITHSTKIIYSSGKKPREGGQHWVRLSYIISSDQPEQQSEISILDSPIAEAGKGAEPKRDRSREGEEQDIFTAGGQKSGFYEDAQQKRTEAPSEDEGYQHLGQWAQRNKHSQRDANTAGAKDASSQEQGELEKARAVLQTIVDTHEDTIAETTPLDCIAGLTTEQVRQAERAVAQAIIDKHSKGGSVERKYKSVVKKTPQGELNLRIRKETWMKEGLELHLNANGSDSLLLTNRYALEEPREGIIRPVGFYDYRHGERAATLSALERAENEASQLEDKRMMWRGLRWMSANMLAWDNPNTIMPEVLDSAYYRNSERPPQTQDAKLRELEEQMRVQLQAEQERRGENFNGAEFVRQQLASEASQAEGESYQYDQSLLTAFDAVAYERYASSVVKEGALDRLAESEAADGRYVHKIIGVTSQVAGTLGVLTNVLDIPHSSWVDYHRSHPYFRGKGIPVSSKAINDLVERSEGKLKRSQRLKRQHFKEPTE